jgi:GT2 family glycosyltransferase
MSGRDMDEDSSSSCRAQISVVLGTYNRKSYLKKTIANIREELKLVPLRSEIIVVDGGSDDGSISWLVRQKDVISIIQHNRGRWNGDIVQQRSWGYFMNLAFKCAQGKYICMVSDDSLLVPGSLKNGIEDFESLLAVGKKVGALAFYWRNWPTYNRYFIIKVKQQPYLNHGLFLRQALERVGYINEDDYYFYCADTELSFKLTAAGYAVETTSRALVEHSQHVNRKVRQANKGKNKERLAHDEAALQRNWRNFFGADEYRDVVKYEENQDIIPDDSFAEQHFGRAYRAELLRSRLRYYFSDLPAGIINKLLVKKS